MFQYRQVLVRSARALGTFSHCVPHPRRDEPLSELQSHRSDASNDSECQRATSAHTLFDSMARRVELGSSLEAGPGVEVSTEVLTWTGVTAS